MMNGTISDKVRSTLQAQKTSYSRCAFGRPGRHRKRRNTHSNPKQKKTTNRYVLHSLPLLRGADLRRYGVECCCFRWFVAPLEEFEENFKVFAVVRHPWLAGQAYTCSVTGVNFFPSSGLYSSLTQ